MLHIRSSSGCVGCGQSRQTEVNDEELLLTWDKLCTLKRCSSTMGGWTHFGHIPPKSVHNMSKICPKPQICPKCAQNTSNPVKYVQRFDKFWTPDREIRKHVQICMICSKYVQKVPKLWTLLVHFELVFLKSRSVQRSGHILDTI